MEKATMSVQELSMQMGISMPKAYELVKAPAFPSSASAHAFLSRSMRISSGCSDSPPKNDQKPFCREEVRKWNEKQTPTP